MSNARYNLFPSKPVFRAGISTGSSWDTSSPYNSTTDVIFDQVYVNRGSDYSSTTGRFTVSIAGTYCFHMSALLANGQSSMSGGIYFAVNGSKADGPVIYTGYAGSFMWISASSVIDLSENDYVTIQNYGGLPWHLNPSDSNEHNSFSGYLVS